MRGLDDGPDGLNDRAFDRALGISAKPKRARKLKPHHDAATRIDPFVPSIAPYVADTEQARRNSLAAHYACGWYAGVLLRIAQMPCSATWTDGACASCSARDALVENGELPGVWEVFALLVEACRG